MHLRVGVSQEFCIKISIGIQLLTDRKTEKHTTLLSLDIASQLPPSSTSYVMNIIFVLRLGVKTYMSYSFIVKTKYY